MFCEAQRDCGERQGLTFPYWLPGGGSAASTAVPVLGRLYLNNQSMRSESEPHAAIRGPANLELSDSSSAEFTVIICV
jgi:hypothetical protein